MPNWTFNTITLKGERKDIDAIHERMGSDFDFNALIKMPEELNVTSGSITQPAIIMAIAEENGGIENLKNCE